MDILRRDEKIITRSPSKYINQEIDLLNIFLMSVTLL